MALGLRWAGDAAPMLAVAEKNNIVSPDAPISEAARLLVENQVECLIVVEGSDLVGLATRTDLLRETARRPVR